MISKIKLIPVYLIGLLVLQSCNPANFKSVEPAAPTTVLESQSGFSSIAVSGNLSTSQTPIKLFLVMDFSYSMVNELTKVKNALDQFIDAQKTLQAFDIYLYPISDHVEGVLSGNTSTYKIRAPLALMELRNNSNFASAKANFMSTLQQKINQASNNTDEVSETGLCQIVRILKQDNLYTANDKVAFVVLTDEDDASFDPNRCIEKTTSDIFPVISLIYGNYLSTLATAYVSGLKSTDGGSMISFAHEYIAAAPSCSSYGIGCSPHTAECSAELKAYLKTSYTSASHVVETVESCQVVVQISSLGFQSLYISLMRTLSQQVLSSTDIENILNHGQGFTYNGTAYSSIHDYVNRVYPQYSSNLTFTLANAGNTIYQQHAEFSLGSKMANNAAIMNLINQKIPNSSVAMDFVIYNPALNPLGTTCAAGDGGILGQNYMDFIHQAGRELFRTESICQSNYNSPLVHAASLSQWIPQRDYTLTGFNAENSAKIKTVKIVDAHNIVLASLAVGQFSLNSTTKVLSIPAPIALPQGTKIIFEE